MRRLAAEQLPGLYAFARHLAGEGADDLVQETLLRACRSLDTLEDPQAAPKWLRVIMANAWKDQLRKQGRRPVEVLAGDVGRAVAGNGNGNGRTSDNRSLYRRLVDTDPFPYSDTMHVDFLGSFSREDIHVVLERLPERYRVPLVMHHLQGFSTAEVAELLDLPKGTVYSHLYRGRQQFEQALWDHAVESGTVPDRDAAADREKTA